MKIACRTRKLRAVVKRFAPAKHKRVRQDALYLVSVLFEQFYDELRYLPDNLPDEASPADTAQPL